jgi:excisionase family DNA binding protein
MEFFTVPAVAKRFGVNQTKVLSWIKSGELNALDVSQARGDRPRWRVSQDDLDQFCESRRAVPAPKPVRNRKRLEGVTEFF